MKFTDNHDFANALRTLADFYDGNSLVPPPFDLLCESPMCFIRESAGDAKAILRSLGSFEKCIDNDPRFGFRALKKVGPWTLQFMAHREAVCTRKVLGTRTIPAHVIPAKEEEIVPEREEEIVEWDCHAVLADGEGA